MTAKFCVRCADVAASGGMALTVVAVASPQAVEALAHAAQHQVRLQSLAHDSTSSPLVAYPTDFNPEMASITLRAIARSRDE